MPDSNPADAAPSPAKAQEPGNRLGALGLLLVAAGAGRLLFEVPPTVLSFPRSVGTAGAAAGGILLILGLVFEWRGPRRWSALAPGVAALAFGLWIGGAALRHASTGPQVQRTVIEADEASLHAVYYAPASGSVEGCAVLVGGAPDVRDATARALANRGVVALRASRSESAAGVDALGASLQNERTGNACALIVHGSIEDPARILAQGVGFERAVALSFPAADQVSAPRSAVPTLYLFGSQQGKGQRHANALMAQLSQIEGGSPAVLRIFLGADQDFLVPRRQVWRQPGHLAPGYADMLARWVIDGAV